MKQSSSDLERARRLLACAGVVVVLSCFGLFVSTAARASYEQVGNFAGTPGVLQGFGTSWPEDVQLGGVSGMAVNYTGAGRVPAGTIYAVGETLNRGARVTRFNPDGSFREAWNSLGNPPIVRCGPEGVLAEPVCPSAPEALVGSMGVAVDQTTGDVYVFWGTSSNAGSDEIKVYAPDGSRVIAEFGERASGNETISESPEKVHETFGSGALAVNAAGDVYLFDYTILGSQRSYRVMEFEPRSPGDYEHYVYAGQDHDVAVAKSGGNEPAHPVVDDAGNLFVGFSEYIAEYDPGSPGSSPLCEFKFPTGGIETITVNPEDGEVFFYTAKDKKIHRLRSCTEGKFVEAGTIALSPVRSEAIGGLAFDPVRRFAPDRPPGVLYAAAAGGEGGNVEEGGLHESSLGYVFARPPELAPVVGSESVSRVTSSTALLSGMVDPEGATTRYVFQYVSQTEYEEREAGEPFSGASEAPVGGGTVGEGSAMVAVSASVSGLVPGTAYRYRVVASSHCSVEDPEKVCSTPGEAQGFRTFPVEAGGLPDGRVYELVSPPDKHGGQVWPADPSIGSCFGGAGGCKPGDRGLPFPMQSSPDGNTIVYQGSPFSASEGGVTRDEYVARRDWNSGWQTTDLTPGLLKGSEGGGYKAFSADLTQGILASSFRFVLSPEAPDEYPNVYSQSTTDPGKPVPLLTTAPPNRASGTFSIEYVGHSADFSHQFFRANDALSEETPFAPAAVDGGESKDNLYEWDDGVLRLVNVLPGNTETQAGATLGSVNPDAHAISDDGSRVYWSSAAGQLYVREDGERTREIPNHAATFLSASVDGSRVLLSDGHVYDLETEVLTDLTAGKGGFQGILGQGTDLAHIYFVDTAALTPSGEKNANHEHAVEGEDNLYSWHEGASVFVATLLPGDNSARGDWQALPSSRTAEASPDGRWLTFLSEARLTGYDNTGPNTGPCTFVENGHVVPGPCAEVFLYDSASNRLVCASCDPSGARPLGASVLRLIDPPAATSMPQPRYLTDEGRVFFDSRDSLSPFDTNEGVEDVYEYEPRGAGVLGTCEREAGCVFLISAGTGSADSNLVGIDETGANVFFTTRDRLSLKDRDEAIDLYDAREGGGIPAETETGHGECHEEGCLPPPPTTVAPGETTSASTVFSGPGNLVSALPGVVVAPKRKAPVPTSAQRLVKALQACRKQPKVKRRRCEATARKRYASKPKSKRSSRKAGK